MEQIARRNKIVPVMEGLVKDDVSFDKFRVGISHGSIYLVHLVHNFRDHIQASGRDSATGSLAGVFHGQERMSVPRFRYLGEEAVLDRVELGTVRGIVHDKDAHAYAAGKVDKVLLDDMVSAGVGAAAVAEHLEKVGVGDLEGDTIIGRNHKGAIVTINDRMTGYSWSAQLEDKGADNVADAIIQMLMPFKGYLHTLTFDSGREFAHHEKVSEALGVSIFFAKPYHSWERGANENTNGLYRQYIPKGTDFQTLDRTSCPQPG